MSQKKVVFLNTSTGWGGLEMNMINLARQMSDVGYQVHLISQENSTIYEKGQAVFSSISLIERKRKYFDFSAAKAFAQAMKSSSQDTVVVFDNKELDMVAWAKKLHFKSMRVLYLQQMQIGVNKKDLLHTFRYSAIDKWIAPLPYLKKEVGLRTQFPVSKVELIPLCLEVDAFIESPYTKAEAREKLNLQPKSTLVGILGRISEKKGQQFVVECIEQLRAEGQQVELLVFGSPTVNDPECQAYHQRMLDYIEHKNLSDCVHLVPYQKDVPLFYAAVDLFIMASHSETFGMVTVEAMLSELPIIGTNTGGTPELLENGEVGALFEYGNHASLKHEIKKYLDHPAELQNKATLAKKIAAEKYNHRVWVKGLDLLIQGKSLEG